MALAQPYLLNKMKERLQTFCRELRPWWSGCLRGCLWGFNLDVTEAEKTLSCIFVPVIETGSSASLTRARVEIIVERSPHFTRKSLVP